MVITMTTQPSPVKLVMWLALPAPQDFPTLVLLAPLFTTIWSPLLPAMPHVLLSTTISN